MWFTALARRERGDPPAGGWVRVLPSAFRFLPTGFLHPIVIGPAAALRRNPGDDLVGIGDIAGFAVDAVGRIEFEAFALASGQFLHLIDRRGTKVLARVSKLLRATDVADIKVGNLQM